MAKYIILLVTIFTIGCKQKMPTTQIVNIGITDCRRQPAFIKNTNLNPQRAALSTSEKRIKGLVLIEVSLSATDSIRQTWQHKTWSQYGWMGPITSDERGNTFIAPVPAINVFDNPADKQNTIYKVESTTGEMSPFINLAVTNTTDNPYGILGLYYDCHSKHLYASSVSGSTRDNEKGTIVAIDASTQKITDQINNTDAIGLCVGGITGEKRLYFGSARYSTVFSIGITATGKFKGKPEIAFSLDMLGAQGDDKARRIRFDKNGDILIYGIPFNYNLTALSEKKENQYRFRYNNEKEKWVQVD